MSHRFDKPGLLVGLCSGGLRAAVRSSLAVLALAASGVACGGASDDGDVGEGDAESFGATSQGLGANDAMPAAGATVVGTSTGSLTVTRLGEASYAVPLAVAPGPGGMQPSLALEYKSDGPDGIFGVGFALSGLSGITRCNRTRAQDGDPGSLSWNHEDRFCLDGQRLVAVSGAYGADGTEYRTEVESFTKVVSRGSANGGPVSFDVWTRDGRVMQLGGTETSRVERWKSSAVHRWLLNRVTDRVGNGFDVAYFENNGTSTANPTLLTSFGANGTPTGQTVQLVYEVRPDVRTVFQAGNFFRPYQRVKRVVVKDGAAIARTYDLAYDAGAAGGRSRLLSVTECGTGNVCFAPTRFAWSAPSFGYDRRWFGGDGQGGLLTGDFDGDGRADLFTWWNGDWRGWWRLSNGTSFGPWQSVVSDMPPQRTPVVADLNGDGKSDLLTAYTDGRIFVWLSTGSGFAPRQEWSRRGDIFGAFQVGDFDGDGRADLADVQRGAVNVWRSTGASFVGPTTWASTSGELAFGDFDADGRTDLFEVRDHQAFVRLSASSGFRPEVWWGTLLAGTRQFTDVNGDGTTDLVVRDASGVSHVYWSAGDKLVYTQPYAGTAEKDVFVDLNGDGKADLLGFAEGSIRVGLARTHSTGFDHVPALDQVFGAHEGPTKGFRLDTRWLTPTGAWLTGGGDLHWEATACQDLGYAPANAGYECGHRAGHVVGRTTGQSCYDTGGESGGQHCSCYDYAQTYRTDGDGGSTAWSPSMDYATSEVNCREECMSWNEGCQWSRTVCDTQFCNAGGCTTSHPPPPGTGLEGTQYRVNGGWSGVHTGPLEDARCHQTVPVGTDCGTPWSAAVGMVRALHCQAPAKPIPADVDGDGLLDIVEVDGAGNLWVDVAVGRNTDVVTRIDDGIGQAHEIDYAKLTAGSSLYSRATEFALTPLGRDVEVVKEIRTSDGRGAMRSVGYAYEGGNVDKGGRGFLGFHKITTSDRSTGHVTVKTFHGGFPVTGTPGREETWVNGVLVRSTRNTTTWTTSAPYVITRTKVEETVKDLDGSAVSHTVTTLAGHAYDFPGTVTVEMRRAPGDPAEIVKSVTANTYVHDPATWILGRLTRATVTRSRTGATTAARTSAFSYDDRGLLVSETVEPDRPALATTKTHGHDAFGNRTTTTETANGLSRTVSRTWDANGRFVVSEQNALGHTTTFETDGRFGLVKKVTDPNALVTTTTYDPLGRMIGETLPDGRVRARFHEAPAAGDPPSAALVARTVTSEAGTTRVVKDVLDRPLRTTTLGFGGKLVHVDTVYDARGVKIRESRPYFAGDARHEVVFVYDALGRETSATWPDGSVASFSYTARTTREVDPRGAVKRKIETVDDKLAQVIETVGGRDATLTHAYDAHGQLVASTDPLGATTRMTYDVRGRRTSIEEPSTGKRTFTVDALGRTIREVDAKGEIVELTHDALDRVTRRVEKSGAGVVLRDTTFTFDTAVSGGKTIRGALAVAVVSERVSGDLVETSRRTLGYDGLARETSETKLVDGFPLRWSRAYEAGTGRVKSVIHPGILTTNGYVALPEYDAAGHTVAIRRSSATGPVVWRALAADASGNVTQETLENGLVTFRTYDARNGHLLAIKTPRKDSVACVPAVCTPGTTGCVFDADANRHEKLPSGCAGETPQDTELSLDAMGNVTSRKDKVTGLTESFTYDELDRLTSVSGPATKSFTYDDGGNLLSKSDFGTYAYDATKKHRVTSVTKAGATVASYTYDANGNTLTDGQRTFSWTSFDKPARIEAGAAFVDFRYDDQNELLSQRTSSGSTVYFGDDFELELKSDGTRERRTYVRVGGVIRAVQRSLAAPGDTVETHASPTSFLADHLGSTTVATNKLGEVVQRLSYDAHGKRRFTTGKDDVVGALRGRTTDRGFTGHQMLDDLDVVFMKARVYDPMLGRFLSGDLVVQSIEDVNGIHRYAYGGNNPLSTIDPSGHFFKSIWKAVRRVVHIVVAVVVTVVVAWVAPQLLPALSPFWQGVVVGATAGAITGAISGGAKGALLGAITGAAFGAVGGIDWSGAFGGPVGGALAKGVAHGTISGVSQVLQGGEFLHGFAAGFAHGFGAPIVGESGGVFERTLVAAAVGGVASKLSGGSFENGAMSGAFAQLFNDWQHDALDRLRRGQSPFGYRDLHNEPGYRSNHDKSPEPRDARRVWERGHLLPASPTGHNQMRFFARGEGGIYSYQVSQGQNGERQAHWSGTIDRSNVRAHPEWRALMRSVLTAGGTSRARGDDR